jgi:putative DNA primase/helicase
MGKVRNRVLTACTDAGNAEWFASLNEDDLRFDHLRKQWLIWDKHRWREDVDGLVLLLAKQAARYRLTCAKEILDDSIRQRNIKWSVASEAWGRLKATIVLAEAEPPLADAGNDWNPNPWLLGVKDGVVDLKTGQARPGLRSDKITFHSDVAFNTRAKCDGWLKFLDDIFLFDKELIEYVQRAVGYSLSGDTREQCAFLCQGEGSNGKSTFLATLRRVFGRYAQNLPFSAFELTARTAVPNDVASILGKRFVTAIETNELARLNEARIKALTGEDSITARFLYREHFTFRPIAKVWLAFNQKPLVSDDSHGFWRRIRLIPFEASFKGDKVDKQLAAKLLSEAEGILVWAVRGCLAWQERGLAAPRQISESTAAYQAESDPLRDFIEDRCVVHPDVETTAALLWHCYCDWAKDSGMRWSLSRVQFVQRLEKMGLRKTRSGHERTRMWIGICRAIDASEHALSDPADVRTSPDSNIQ